MSFSYELAGDARPELQALDVWLQEKVLDAVEALTADAARAEADLPAELVLEVEASRRRRLYFVDIRLVCDPRRKMLSIVGIKLFETRPFI